LGQVEVLRVLRNVFFSKPKIQNEQAAECVNDILNVSFLSIANPVVFDAIVGIEPVRISASSWLPPVKGPDAGASQRLIRPDDRKFFGLDRYTRTNGIPDSREVELPNVRATWRQALLDTKGFPDIFAFRTRPKKKIGESSRIDA
jgi:predicted AAA+ superfamily ATPase